LTHADHIQLVDWIGSRLIFEQVVPGNPAANPYSIITYDYAANSRFQVASAAHFNTVISAQGLIYYAIAPDADDLSTQAFFYRVAPDGSNKQTVLEKEVWSAYRTGYDSISLQTSGGWYAYTISSNNNTPASGPSVYVNRLFNEHPANNGRSLWADVRDGQGVLLTHNKSDGKDSVVVLQPGLTYPVRWLTDDAAVYRVVTSAETADYAVGMGGGQHPHKIADVVNTYGFGNSQ
jgi:hypothetical protein